MTKTNTTRVLLLFIMGIALTNAANGLSVASDYLENDTMVLQKGESKIYGIRLQNEKNTDIFMRILYDSDFATIADYREIYEVPAKSSLSIKFNVSSEGIGHGNTKTMSYTVEELLGSGSGVPVLLKINKNFKVQVSDKEKQLEWKEFIVYGILAAAFLYFACSKSKYSPKQINPRKKK